MYFGSLDRNTGLYLFVHFPNFSEHLKRISHLMSLLKYCSTFQLLPITHNSKNTKLKKTNKKLCDIRLKRGSVTDICFHFPSNIKHKATQVNIAESKTRKFLLSSLLVQSKKKHLTPSGPPWLLLCPSEHELHVTECE